MNPIRIEPPTSYYIGEGIKLLLGLIIMGLLIAVVVCLCGNIGAIKDVVKDIHKCILLFKELAPCVQEYCQEL